MELSEREKCESEKEDQLNYYNGGYAPEWQLRSTSAGVASGDRGGGSESQRSSFNPSPWNPNLNPSNLGFGEADIAAMSKSVSGSWNHQDSLHGGGSGGGGGGGGGGFLLPNLSHFPVDSDFIKRAARFSCFNAPNPLSALPHSLNAHAQKIDINMSKTLKDVSLPGSPEAEKIRAVSGGADPGGSDRECAANLAEVSSSRDLLAASKRKRSSKELEVNQTKGDPQMPTKTKENVDTNQKSNGKQVKDDVPEAPKEDYIHVRARRGQATNSHSLAERVRREKISQRMKFLQELVPGCSKVTGKAVMLDEIINYVQSLQRQVEFLSMKLATVNPRMDFNLEAFLYKDYLQPETGPSSAIGFSSDMAHPQLQLSQQGLMQTGNSGNRNPPSVIRIAVNPQMNPIHNSWDEQLQNLMQMATFGNTNNSQHPRTQ